MAASEPGDGEDVDGGEKMGGGLEELRPSEGEDEERDVAVGGGLEEERRRG